VKSWTLSRSRRCHTGHWLRCCRLSCSSATTRCRLSSPALVPLADCTRRRRLSCTRAAQKYAHWHHTRSRPTQRAETVWCPLPRRAAPPSASRRRRGSWRCRRRHPSLGARGWRAAWLPDWWATTAGGGPPVGGVHVDLLHAGTLEEEKVPFVPGNKSAKQYDLPGRRVDLN